MAKPKKDALTRAIEARERSLRRAEDRIADIRDQAEEQIAVIKKNMAKTSVLLDALKRGALKP